MGHQQDKKLLVDMATIQRQAQNYSGVDRCLIAPSPRLRKRLKQEIAELRNATSGVMINMLRVREARAPGMNDGLIYPGDTFPLGTPVRVVREAAIARAPVAGTLRVVVVLVQFSDKALTQTREHFEELFFSTGALPNGSVREYYREVTDNLVDIVGEVVGPYTLPKRLVEYTNGASGTGLMQPNARTMALDTAQASNADVDFSIYDNDQDGFVDAFIVVHAGKGAENTGSVNDLWSHKWVLPNGSFDADGTKIYAYLTVPEDSKIGVCCHELGHLLFGFPDLYDTDYSSEGVGSWCVMGGGSWNGNGEIPAHPSAWCKANQGWVSVVTPTNNGVHIIPDVKTDRKVYKLWKGGGIGNEYFLLENRRRTLYDRLLPGEGLLIWHVDDSIPSNTDENHPKVALVQADAKSDLEKGNNRGDGGDPYPGNSNNSSFSATSTPNSNSYAHMDTCVAVTEISISGADISARLVVTCPGEGGGKKGPDWRKALQELYKRLKGILGR